MPGRVCDHDHSHFSFTVHISAFRHCVILLIWNLESDRDGPRECHWPTLCLNSIKFAVAVNFTRGPGKNESGI